MKAFNKKFAFNASMKTLGTFLSALCHDCAGYQISVLLAAHQSAVATVTQFAYKNQCGVDENLKNFFKVFTEDFSLYLLLCFSPLRANKIKRGGRGQGMK